MTRVPAALAVLLLAGSGVPVRPATLRQWKTRGHLSKGDGYDVAEILEYATARGLVTA